jgi:tetratricopeptide (TPR) repeat protein
MARKKKSTRSKRLDSNAYDKLDEISKLITRNNFDDADDLLDELETQYARNDAILESRGDFYMAIGDLSEAWWHMYQAVELNSDNMSALSNLIFLSSRLGLLYATVVYIEKYKENSVIMPPALVRQYDEFKKIIADIQGDNPERQGKSINDLMLLDLTSQLTQIHQIDEAEKICRRALKKLPDLVHVHHLWSTILSQKGQLLKAIDHLEKVQPQFPDDQITKIALCDMYFFKGEVEVAEKLCQEILKEPTTTSYETQLRIEMLAVLNKPQDIVDIFEANADPTGKTDIDVNTLHLVATSFALLGDVEQARTLWKNIVEAAPMIVEDNLDDLTKPAYMQNGIAYFEMPFWIPSAWIDMLSVPAKNIAQNKVRIQKLFKKSPWLEHLVKVLFERGNQEGREFALHLCQSNPLPILEPFVTGKAGTDHDRLTGLKIMLDNDMMTRENLPDMWMDGEWEQPELFKYNTTYDAVESYDNKDVQQLIQEIHDVIRAGDFETALDMLDEAGDIDPDNRTLLNYELVAYNQLGMEDYALDVLDEMVDKHPDYYFTRIEQARALIKQDKLDEAKDYLTFEKDYDEPVHISELRVYVVASIEWLIAKKMYHKALTWLNQIQVIAPELHGKLNQYYMQILTDRTMSTLFPFLKD